MYSWIQKSRSTRCNIAPILVQFLVVTFDMQNFMFQDYCWSSCCCFGLPLWLAAMIAVWEQLFGLIPCSCATAPCSPLPLERYYCQIYWQTCCSDWWATAGLSSHRYRYLVRNALEKRWQQYCFYLWHIRPESVLTENWKCQPLYYALSQGCFCATKLILDCDIVVILNL